MKKKEYNCDTCADDRFVVTGCCNGRECGCMGMPTTLTNCVDCNPCGRIPMSDAMKSIEYICQLEYVPAVTPTY